MKINYGMEVVCFIIVIPLLWKKMIDNFALFVARTMINTHKTEKIVIEFK